MTKKLSIFLLALFASAGTMFAWDYERVQIGDLYYNLDATNKTAEVTYELAWNEDNYSGLTTATIPSSVTYNAVEYSVTSIGEFAFWECTGLTTMTIGNSVESIGDYTFYYCSGLTSVTIPNSVTSIGEGTFYNCRGLTSPVYNAHVFAFMPTSYSGAYTIPDGIESIAGYAFYNCSGLTSVTIPNSVTSIGFFAFLHCTGLTSVTIPNSVTGIGDGAFEDCSGLTSVTIPNSVTSIGEWAFSSCSGLSSVTNYATTPQSISSIVFHDVNTSTCVLNVPKKSVSLYQAADVWKKFTNIVGVDDYTINYVDKDSQALYNHVVTLYVPVAPTITGYKFLKWVVVNGDLDDGITIQAVYQADVPSAAPEVYTNPSNPAQKLIRNGNVYILTDDSRTYTLTGQQVK